VKINSEGAVLPQIMLSYNIVVPIGLEFSNTPALLGKAKSKPKYDLPGTNWGEQEERKKEREK
jgi:hypothetical protein